MAPGGVDTNGAARSPIDVPEEHNNQFAELAAICSKEKRDMEEAAPAENDCKKDEEDHTEEDKKNDSTIIPGINSKGLPYCEKRPSTYPTIGQF